MPRVDNNQINQQGTIETLEINSRLRSNLSLVIQVAKSSSTVNVAIKTFCCGTSTQALS